eukprot:Hpha_TRINITY_DN15580_c0_g1::TRINITY_DN15580_c0_g1_i3::g.105956::m.105956
MALNGSFGMQTPLNGSFTMQPSLSFQRNLSNNSGRGRKKRARTPWFPRGVEVTSLTMGEEVEAVASLLRVTLEERLASAKAEAEVVARLRQAWPEAEIRRYGEPWEPAGAALDLIVNVSSDDVSESTVRAMLCLDSTQICMADGTTALVRFPKVSVLVCGGGNLGKACGEDWEAWVNDRHHLAPAAMVMRQILGHVGGLEASNGGLPSVAVPVMIAAASRDTTCCGEAFSAFCRVYAQFDFANDAVCLGAPGGVCPKPAHLSGAAVVVLDPCSPGKNLAFGCWSVYHFQLQLRQVSAALSRIRPRGECPTTPLARVVPFKPLTLRAELHAAKGPATPPDNEDLETIPDDDSEIKTATASSLYSPEKSRGELGNGSASPADSTRPLYDAPSLPLRPRSPTHATVTSGSLSAETESLSGITSNAGSPPPDCHADCHTEDSSNVAIVTEAFTDYVAAMGSGSLGEWTSKWLTHDAVVYPTNRHLVPGGYVVGRQAFCEFYNKTLKNVFRSDQDTLGFRILSVEGTETGGRIVASITHSCGGQARMSPPEGSVLRCFDFVLRDGNISMLTSGPFQGAAPVRSDLRPCCHNSWDEYAHEEGRCLLRCRECFCEWDLKGEAAACCGVGSAFVNGT